MEQRKISDLAFIKKHYGENFAHLCRSLFPSVLEHKGLLSEILVENIYTSHSVYEALKDEETKEAFAQLIQYRAHEKLNSLYPTTSTENRGKVVSPFELIKQAGYTLYECKTFKDTLKFRKYYAIAEELCTFDDCERTENHYVFFAVKDNALKIKRAKHPEREDEYGTSVISIQIPKNPPHMVSIKNRYNHLVHNPDATFSNNLENIKSGLTESLSNYCNMPFDLKLPVFLPGFAHANDGKFYPYNEYIDNTYYCPDNIVIQQGCVTQFEKKKFDLVDHFLISKQERTIKDLSQKDSFTKTTGKIDKIEVIKHADTSNNTVTKEIRLTTQRGVSTIFMDSQNQMIEYRNPYLTHIPDNFLNNINNLRVLDLPNVIEIGNDCIQNFQGDALSFENVKTIGNNFAISFNGKSINLPKVKSVGKNFCVYTHDNLELINMPNIQDIEAHFLKDFITCLPNNMVDFTINPEMKELCKILKSKNLCAISPIYARLRMNALRSRQDTFCAQSHHSAPPTYTLPNP